MSELETKRLDSLAWMQRKGIPSLDGLTPESAYQRALWSGSSYERDFFPQYVESPRLTEYR